MKKRESCILIAFVCLAVYSSAVSQSAADKVSATFRFGPNIWINDMNDRTAGVGAEGIARYGLSRIFSVGAMFGYDAIKAQQFPIRLPDIPVDYLKVNVFHASLIGWFQLSSSRRFSPYVYFGGGGMHYTRKDGNGHPYPPDDGPHGSFYIPLGIGFESFVAGTSSLSVDFGYRVIDAATDNLSKGSDSYPTFKIGFTMYFGSNDEDDDDLDGLTNGKERDFGTDPDNPDSDGDTLTDGDEVKTYRTDPTKADTDGDGILDSDEVLRFRTNPQKADTDGDGLSDSDELYKYNTDPLKVDSDKDGLNDGEEVLTYRTDPLKQDTDGDELPDSNELFGYRTDPLKADSDGGGVDDGVEVKRGTNPLYGEDDFPSKRDVLPPMRIGESILLESIKFRSLGSEINPAAELALERVLETLAINPTMEFEIRGYTDNTGDKERNIKISRERAQAVKRWLEARGIAPTRLVAKGFGPENPVASNSTEAGREKNRRIEFLRTK